MIYSPSTIDTVQLQNIDQWNVFGWNIVEHLAKDRAFNCSDVELGLSKSAELKNLNGLYTLTSLVYKNNPVYINNKQNIVVTGTGYAFGTDISSLDLTERLEILQDIDDGGTTHSIYRDGPYLLGKFGPDDVWAIMRLPSSFGNGIVTTDSINMEDITENEIIESIIVHQSLKNPPQSFKNNGSAISKKYTNWQNSYSPLSRDWSVNTSKIAQTRCNYQHNTDEVVNLHFSTSISTIIDPEIFDRKPVEIASGVPFYKRVYTEFLTLKNILPNNGISTNIIFPPVLNKFVATLSLANEINYADGEVDELGSIDGRTIIGLDINGQFINNSTMPSIIYGCEYKIDTVEILSQIDDEPIVSQVLYPNNFKTGLNYIAYNWLNWTKQQLTNWSRTKAFLYEPSLFKDDWLDIASLFVVDTTDTSSVYFSKYTDKILFSSYIEARFYDRLYDFMKIKGF
jgi:hypothetical protein